MKISLALGQRRPLDRTTAWGCLTANLAVPGCGSLVAGRVSGYFQLLLAMAGVTLTTLFGLKFIVWYVNNWSQLQQTQADTAANFQELWARLRWAVFGMLIFLAGLFWALASSAGIILQARRDTADQPPVLAPGLKGDSNKPSSHV
jgi:hypothetical protein